MRKFLMLLEAFFEAGLYWLFDSANYCGNRHAELEFTERGTIIGMHIYILRLLDSAVDTFRTYLLYTYSRCDICAISAR